jgi:hypothetical protein
LTTLSKDKMKMFYIGSSWLMAGMGSGVPQDKSFPSSAVLVLPGMMQQKKSGVMRRLSGMSQVERHVRDHWRI